MSREAGHQPAELRVDGGATANDFLCQFQADILGVPILRPRVRETTGLGAAYLAGLGVGLWRGPEALRELWQLDRRFTPAMPADRREALYADWRTVVTLPSVVLSTFVSVAVGVLSGLYPATRASEIDPAEALGYE